MGPYRTPAKTQKKQTLVGAIVTSDPSLWEYIEFKSEILSPMDNDNRVISISWRGGSVWHFFSWMKLKMVVRSSLIIAGKFEQEEFELELSPKEIKKLKSFISAVIRADRMKRIESERIRTLKKEHEKDKVLDSFESVLCK